MNKKARERRKIEYSASIAIAMVKNCNEVKREKGEQLWMLIYDLMH